MSTSSARARWAGAWRLLPMALTAIGFAFGLAMLAGMGLRSDAMVYHGISLEDPYGPLVGQEGAFLYSPVFVQATTPLRALPVEVFVTVWRLAELGLLALLAGPFTLPVLLTVPVTAELMEAQVHLLMAGAIVAAFRWPALWAMPILTKPTVGVALLYYVGARDWRGLRTAIVVTAVVVGVSFALAPHLWFGWAEILLGSAASPPVTGPLVAIPLVVRLVVAGALAWVAGVRGWPRLVPVAATIALPVLWIVGLSMLVAVLADPARTRFGVHVGELRVRPVAHQERERVSAT